MPSCVMNKADTLIRKEIKILYFLSFYFFMEKLALESLPQSN